MEALPHLGTIFGTLGRSLTKIGTSIPKEPRLLSSFLWSTYSFRDPQEGIGGGSPPRNWLWNPRYILKKIWYIFKRFWYIKFSSYRDPYHPSYCLFVQLRPLRSDWRFYPPQKGLWNLSTSSTKISISLRKIGPNSLRMGCTYFSKVHSKFDFQGWCMVANHSLICLKKHIYFLKGLYVFWWKM